jgi:hypothetical protein
VRLRLGPARSEKASTRQDRVEQVRSTPGWAGPASNGEAGCEFDGKYVQPAWWPPLEIKLDNPRLPTGIPGGSPRNPMGAGAL